MFGGKKSTARDSVRACHDVHNLKVNDCQSEGGKQCANPALETESEKRSCQAAVCCVHRAHELDQGSSKSRCAGAIPSQVQGPLVLVLQERFLLFLRLSLYLSELCV